jgi:hypothetical protein
MAGSNTHQWWMTVTQAARHLGVSRNDMIKIPVSRYRLGQVQGYRTTDIVAFGATTNDARLNTLRARKSKALNRQATRENPYTKTGKLKKRYETPATIPCPRCGGSLDQVPLAPTLMQNFPGLRRILTKLNGTSDNLEVQLGKLKNLERQILENCDSEIESGLEDYIELLEKVKQSIGIQCTQCRFLYVRQRARQTDANDEIDDDETVTYDEPSEPVGVSRNGLTLAPLEHGDEVTALSITFHP